MIERFLSLFRRYREARHEILSWRESHAGVIQNANEAQRDKLRIQDHNNWLNAELQRAREELKDAHRDEREALKMVGNLGWQQKNGWVPWPESGRLPQDYVEAGAPGPLKSNGGMGQDDVRKQNAAVLQEYLNPGKHPELRAKKG